MYPFKRGLQKVDRSLRLHGAIAHDLGLSIVSGAYSDGETLSGEIETSEELAVSRTAYREAIRILAAKGLVCSKPKIGTRVCPRSRWQLLDPDVMAWTLEAGPDVKTLDSLYELRGLLEPAAAAFAAQRRTDTHLRAMADALSRMKRYTLETEAGRQADVEFHTALMCAADNPYMLSLVDGIGSAILTTTIYKYHENSIKKDPTPDHVAVFEAIADADADRAKTTMQHLIVLSRNDFPDLPVSKPRPVKFGCKKP